MVTYNQIKNNETIKTYIQKANEALSVLGYTEHSFAHVTKVAENVKYILSTLSYSQHEIELAQIAGYIHDIGNIVNRDDHAHSGALIAFRILDNLDMPPCDIATVVSAIGNHDEGTGIAVSPVSAALILSDKSDVRRSRVTNKDLTSFDIHDRVNYSVTRSSLDINEEGDEIRLSLEIDTHYSSVMDYFEIFMGRMMMCRKAAEFLKLKFTLVINGQTLI